MTTNTNRITVATSMDPMQKTLKGLQVKHGPTMCSMASTVAMNVRNMRVTMYTMREMSMRAMDVVGWRGAVPLLMLCRLAIAL